MEKATTKEHIGGTMRGATLCVVALTLVVRGIQALQMTTGWRQEEAGEEQPGARAGASVWLDGNGQAWLFGGRAASSTRTNDTVLLADLWSFDVAERQWRLQASTSASSAPEGRELAVMCGVTGATVVVFGGRTSDDETVGDVLIWHQVSTQWQTLRCNDSDDRQPPTCPPPRYDALVWCDGIRMSIVGGLNGSGRRLQDSWTFDLGRLTWTEIAAPDTNCASQSGALVWSTTAAPNGNAIYVMCDGGGQGNASTSDTNVQLWRQTSSEPSTSWELIAESSEEGSTAWPGGHHHGVTTTDAAGHLWLFGGQSQLGAHRFLNNDLWMYNASSWHKVALPPDDADEPAPRQFAAGFLHADIMFVYGGSVCADDDDSTSLVGDLWVLNVSAMRRTDDNFVPRVPARDEHLAGTAAAAKRSTQPTYHAEVHADDHGNAAFGSAAIFFGVSLSMFAVFGVAIFVRRCVSCPPTDRVLLKVPPPVRYTVIPDDTI